MTTAEPLAAAPDPAARLRRLVAAGTGLLCAVIPAVRPLVWDGDPASPANLGFLVLVLVALGLGTIELAAGWRRTWRWGWGGAVLAALVAWLALAAWRAGDPVAGAAFWVQLALHGALAAWLVQAAPGRERLVLAGLVAGLGVESGLALLQKAWVLPGIAAADQAGSAMVAMEGVPAGDLASRVAFGGVYGTFTLSNTLAAFLILLLPPAAAAAWSPGRLPARAAVGLAVLAAAAALVSTNSKGAWLALAAAGGVAWMLWLRGWWRWLPLPLGALAAAVLWMSAGARAGLVASAEVRWGYWIGAARLAAEQPLLGLGWGAFAERSAAAMPLWAEPTRLVHNEVLEALVVAGIPGALLLAALLLLLPCGRARAPAALEESPPAWALGLMAAVVVAYFGLLGAYEGNISWWPGGRTVAGLLGWCALLGLATGALVALAAGLSVPAARWWRLGLAACALHCLIDFDLHAAAMWGMLAAVAALVGGARERPLPGVARVAAPLALLALALLLVAWAGRAAGQRASEDTAKMLRLAATGDQAQRDEVFAVLADRAGAEKPQGQGERAQLWHLAWQQAERAAAGDARLTFHLLALLPPGGDRLARLEALLPDLPYSAALREQLAADLAAQRRWDEALASQRAAVALAPAQLAVRRRLADLLERAAGLQPVRASAFKAEALTVRAEAERLEPVVHPRNRN
ncbi:MAG: O-antigen ligase family protein [Planctomycetes bacterium]|nr:O-antigen ligase family protein [Planctomycetota bacterium]